MGVEMIEQIVSDVIENGRNNIHELANGFFDMVDQSSSYIIDMERNSKGKKFNNKAIEYNSSNDEDDDINDADEKIISGKSNDGKELSNKQNDHDKALSRNDESALSRNNESNKQKELSCKQNLSNKSPVDEEYDKQIEYLGDQYIEKKYVYTTNEISNDEDETTESMNFIISRDRIINLIEAKNKIESDFNENDLSNIFQSSVMNAQNQLKYVKKLHKDIVAYQSEILGPDSCNKYIPCIDCKSSKELEKILEKHNDIENLILNTSDLDLKSVSKDYLNITSEILNNTYNSYSYTQIDHLIDDMYIKPQDLLKIIIQIRNEKWNQIIDKNSTIHNKSILSNDSFWILNSKIYNDIYIRYCKQYNANYSYMGNNADSVEDIKTKVSEIVNDIEYDIRMQSNESSNSGIYKNIRSLANANVDRNMNELTEKRNMSEHLDIEGRKNDIEEIVNSSNELKVLNGISLRAIALLSKFSCHAQYKNKLSNLQDLFSYLEEELQNIGKLQHDFDNIAKVVYIGELIKCIHDRIEGIQHLQKDSMDSLSNFLARNNHTIGNEKFTNAIFNTLIQCNERRNLNLIGIVSFMNNFFANVTTEINSGFISVRKAIDPIVEYMLRSNFVENSVRTISYVTDKLCCVLLHSFEPIIKYLNIIARNIYNIAHKYLSYVYCKVKELIEYIIESVKNVLKYLYDYMCKHKLQAFMMLCMIPMGFMILNLINYISYFKMIIYL